MPIEGRNTWEKIGFHLPRPNLCFSQAPDGQRPANMEGSEISNIRFGKSSDRALEFGTTASGDDPVPRGFVASAPGELWWESAMSNGVRHPLGVLRQTSILIVKTEYGAHPSDESFVPSAFSAGFFIKNAQFM